MLPGEYFLTQTLEGTLAETWRLKQAGTLQIK